jgi:hypothetical protein
MPQDFLAGAGAKGLRDAFAFDATLDLANHAAVASVDTTVTVPAGSELMASDLIVPIPPSTLEAGIASQGCRYVSATTFNLRTTNASAGAINPASATWTFVVYRR